MGAELEAALRELELSTGSLLESDMTDSGRIGEALDRRARAITQLAALSSELNRNGPEAVRRMEKAFGRGEEASRRARAMKQSAIEEWARLQQLSRGVEEGRPEAARRVDYSG